jgi:Ca-activated chloride channel homolog
MRHRFFILPLATVVIACQMVAAQERCLTKDDIAVIRSKIEKQEPVVLNKKLRNELLKIKDQTQQRVNDDIRENRKPNEFIERMRKKRLENAARLCAILKEYGWPTKALVGEEGVEAALFLLRDSPVAQMKYDLLPVITAAAKIGEVSRPDFASYVDRMRLDAGLKQVFGTQATIADGFLVLYPIESEKGVDARRKQFELPPLDEYIKYLQIKYSLPLVKSTGTLANKFSDSAKASIDQSTAANFLERQPAGDDDVVRIDTNLVSLNVSVFSTKLRATVDTLTQNDFQITEDGRPETISYFATTDVPFDLVLLLDLSGSTAGKRALIRKSTERFITATRPTDRLAIVTFSGDPEIISPLTDDRTKLLERVNMIGDESGPSHIWDALNFTLKEVINGSQTGRRRAVVFMTDGVDNALAGVEAGSRISFGDLLEAVRHSDTLIVPIYLDTESDSYFFNKRMYESARKTLRLLADESGGLYYKAKKIEDLDGVYREVIEDLGKVYSLGYKPSNDNRDGKWRAVKIELANLPDLKARSRPGYYAPSSH